MGATLCRALGTATRGPQSGDRLLSRCHPQRSPVPGQPVAQTIRFCSEARPAKPPASRRSVAAEGQGEPLTPSAPRPCPCGPLLPSSKRPWDPGVRRPLPLPEGREGREQVEFTGCHLRQRPHQRGSWLLVPPCGQGHRPTGSSGFWPESPPAPAPLLWSGSRVLLNSRFPSPLQSRSPGLISVWPSGKAALLYDKFIMCGIVLVGYEKSAVAW